MTNEASTAAQASSQGDAALALWGADPLYKNGWPQWPAWSAEIESNVLRVLRSGRWAISGANVGRPAEERMFGDEFATFIGVDHGVPVANGSAALVTALEAAGIGYGDHVLVPGVVWVACASAVARVGAIPILVDVAEDSFCMSAEAAAAAITPRTRAILLVHLYSSIADLDAFLALVRKHDVVLIEDCSQAHGATWRGQRVGSFGLLGTFSFQNSKLLTAGEGGIVVTDEAPLADAAQQLRGDGRRWREGPHRIMEPDLEHVGIRQGHNLCMSEVEAAILRASLPALVKLNARRAQAVAIFESALDEVKGVSVVRSHDSRITDPTFYHLPIRVDAQAFAGANGRTVGAAVSAEVGMFLEPVDPPLSVHPLYRPQRYTRFSAEHLVELDASSFELPVARRLAESCFTISHWAFLAEEEAILALVRAIAHVQRNARFLR